MVQLEAFFWFSFAVVDLVDCSHHWVSVRRMRCDLYKVYFILCAFMLFKVPVSYTLLCSELCVHSIWSLSACPCYNIFNWIYKADGYDLSFKDVLNLSMNCSKLPAPHVWKIIVV